METTTRQKTLEELKKDFTIETLENSGLEIYGNLEFAKKFKYSYPSFLNKPILYRNPTSEDAKKYIVELEKYENLKLKRDEEIIKCNEISDYVDSIVAEFIKKQSGLYQIPEKSQSKVWSLAYGKGHSSGYLEVYYNLQDLVELFK